MTEGHGAAAPVLRRAVDAFCSEEAASEEGLRWLWLAAGVAGALWDFEAWDVLTARVVKLARDAGALNVLMIGLTTRSTLHVFAGELALAASTVEEAKAIAAACGSRNALYPALALTAFQGRQAEASQVLEAAGQDFRAPGEGMGLTVVDWANAVLYNGLTRYDDAFAAARQASEDPNELRFSAWALAELVEAASRTGHDEHGAHALERLNEIARATGTDWALGIAARSRALLIDDERAECLYRGATNQEIAAQLFISPSTVDYHLRKAFRKLGVKSRTQLARHALVA